MAAILSCRAMLNHRPLRRGCLLEFLYPTGPDLRHVHVPELVGTPHPEIARTPTSVAVPRALQQLVGAHHALGALAVHRPPELEAILAFSEHLKEQLRETPDVKKSAVLGRGRMIEEIVHDPDLLPAAFGTTLRIAEELIGMLAEKNTISDEEMIRRLALLIAERDDQKPGSLAGSLD